MDDTMSQSVEMLGCMRLSTDPMSAAPVPLPRHAAREAVEQSVEEARQHPAVIRVDRDRRTIAAQVRYIIVIEVFARGFKPRGGRARTGSTRQEASSC
jgi:hypothetical protein